MALLFPAAYQFLDSNGDPVGAGKLFCYDNGTTNAASAYSNPDLSTGALSSPIVLDSSGRLTTNVYVADGTSFTVKLDTSADAELWSRDDVWGVSSVDFNTDGDLTIPGNLLDIAPAADQDTGVKARNTIGGVFLYVQNTSGIAYLRQMSASGTPEDIWISMHRDGLVSLRYDSTVALRTADDGIEVWSTTGSIPAIDMRTSAGTSLAKIFSGSGSPEGAVTATVGSLFLRSDGGAGTTLYVKESGTGNTGWAAK